MLIWLRSFSFFLGFVVSMVAFLPITLIAIWLPPLSRNGLVVRNWAYVVLWWLKLTCKIDYQVLFKGQLPTQPAIIMSKHQSAWETLALQIIMPLHVWVLKRELLWLPIFGWQLYAMGPIAINRNKGNQSQKQLLTQGKARIQQGFWILVFPEGTRIAPGKRGKYKFGGARLAQLLNMPLVPIAHNAGEFWPKKSFLKYPGTISVTIGEPIYPEGQDIQTITAQVEAWIENEMRPITGLGPMGPKPTNL